MRENLKQIIKVLFHRIITPQDGFPASQIHTEYAVSIQIRDQLYQGFKGSCAGAFGYRRGITESTALMTFSGQRDRNNQRFPGAFRAVRVQGVVNTPQLPRAVFPKDTRRCVACLSWLCSSRYTGHLPERSACFDTLRGSNWR